MGIDGSAGLVTRGFGADHKILTRGFGARLDLGGVRFSRKKVREYDLRINVPILKENYKEINFYLPVEIKKRKDILINQKIDKEILSELELIVEVDHTPLFDILDEI